MTQQEALAEATQRWGKGAVAIDRYNNCGLKSRYFVHSQRFARGGNGPTWEAAFADADKRIAEREPKEQP